MKQKTKVLVAGHICLDITPIIDQKSNKPLHEVITPGTLSTVSDVVLSIGGAVFGVGAALARLGISTCLTGVTGDDDFGLIIENKLKELGVACELSKHKKALTSFSIVLSVMGCDRIFFHAPGANNDITSKDVSEDALRNVDLFHFGYPPIMRNMFINDGDELVKLFKKAKKAGVITSLDMAMPDPMSESGQVDWRRVLERVLPYVDIYMPSIEETLFMIDKKQYVAYKKKAVGIDMIDVLDVDILSDVAEKLHLLGAMIVMLKCGYKGCYVSTKEIGDEFGRLSTIDVQKWSNRKLFENCYKVDQIKSTTGAGDTTIAGFLAAMLNGYDIEKAISVATAVGALCVQTHDTVSGILPIESIVEKIENGWGKVE